MADETDRTLVGDLLIEFERQAEEGDLWIGRLCSDGTMQVSGSIDMFSLAAAVREGCTCGQIHQNPAHRCHLHPEVRPKTQEEQAAFARRFDERVVEGRREG